MPRAVVEVSWTIMIGLLAAVAGAQQPAVPVRSALEPATTGGLEVIDRALAKLSTHRRLLMIGAHPDDEDTSVLTLVARGRGGEAAYLALSRGDGGQNLIGPELGVGLGVIRTQELLAARRLDGARQFFTRAFDFGYTRSLEETLRRWPRQALRTDVARIIWRFRPQVVVSMFPGGGGRGHGQHQAAGWVAHEVFPIAGEGDRFQPLIDEGWLPWQPLALYRRAFRDPQSASLRVSLGGIDHLTGKSMLQIAMQSRSQHRSQDMGTLQPLGTREAGLVWVAGGDGPESDDLFAGIDTSLAAIAASLPEGEDRRRVTEQLGRVEEIARSARLSLTPAAPAAVIPGLVGVLEGLARARELADASIDAMGTSIVRELIDEKREVAQAALAAAAGIGLEATADRRAVAPGGQSEVRAMLWNSGTSDVELRSVEILTGENWVVERLEGEEARVGSAALAEWTFNVSVSAGAEPSMPYYLRAKRQGDLYDWSAAPARLRGLPQQPPELVARFALKVAGLDLTLEREVVHRSRDQVRGEVRRPVRIVPRVEISVDPALALWDPDDSASRQVLVTVRSHVEAPVRGRVTPDFPAGWEAASVAFEIGEPRGQDTLVVEVSPPERLGPGVHDLAFAAEPNDGPTETLAVPLMEYSHIRPTPRPVPAHLRVSAFDLELPHVGTIGYVRGASDRVPEFLGEVGLEVEMLSDSDLSQSDLSRFRVIVIGSRAYEIDPALVAANSRLLDFARAGGLLIVQYQQYQFSRGGYAPYELEISRPHDRITDETAPVRVLEPEHVLFTEPNRLGPSDWQGWVQERGLYFAGTWDPAYRPLLAMSDPEKEEQSGGLLIAAVGEGRYVYTGLAFFRQLPAGVAGGYRLLANLLALSGPSEPERGPD